MSHVFVSVSKVKGFTVPLFNTITNGVFEDVPFDHKNIDRLMDNENYSKS